MKASTQTRKTNSPTSSDTAVARKKIADRPKAKTPGTRKTKGHRKALGDAGEDLSCTYLEQNVFKLLERNWRCSSGEADIIARDEDTLVFIEVKTRSQPGCGLPEDAITARKRARYEDIAINYLMQHQFPSSKVRFDVISIILFSEQKAFLRHHRDAFSSYE